MARTQALPNSTAILRELMIALAGASVVAISAQITIPAEPVPFTLQTMAVMLCGLGLGMKRAIASQVAYLGAGAMGLPVFAKFLSGPAILLGPTGGYLISFLAVAAFLGYCSDRGWDKKVWSCAVILTVGIILNLGLGFSWLSLSIGAPHAFQVGVLPFAALEFGKAAFVVLLVPGAQKLLAQTH